MQSSRLFTIFNVLAVEKNRWLENIFFVFLESESTWENHKKLPVQKYRPIDFRINLLIKKLKIAKPYVFIRMSKLHVFQLV